MKPHLKRWITGLAAVAILFPLVAFGSQQLFSLLIILAALLGMNEYNRMAFGKGLRREKVETTAAALLILLAAAAGDLPLLVACLSGSVMALMILNLLKPGEPGAAVAAAGKAILGICYVPLLMSHFLLVRRTPEGVLWVFFILILAFCGDIAAFYVGKGWGKHKLLPHVSPGKTVEGTLGLVAGSVAGCCVFSRLFFPELPLTEAAVLGLVGSVLGQLGDLSESMLKRAAGMKDSGALLPGHGGILDRLDCLMFIVPFVYYYRVLVVR